MVSCLSIYSSDVSLIASQNCDLVYIDWVMCLRILIFLYLRIYEYMNITVLGEDSAKQTISCERARGNF